MSRLDREREKKLEPERINFAVQQIQAIGLTIQEKNNKMIRFYFNSNLITLFPYSGWFSGKGIKPGRGIKNLIKQLK